jgi:hypothetical protein
MHQAVSLSARTRGSGRERTRRSQLPHSPTRPHASHRALGLQGASGSASFDQSKEKGAFASVAEQSGIMAGSGGFDIRVGGETSLKGAVIASSADAAKNTLATGTLSASNITNTETYKASQIGISVGIAGIGADKNATPPPQNTGNNGQPDASVGSGDPSSLARAQEAEAVAVVLWRGHPMVVQRTGSERAFSNSQPQMLSCPG